MPLGETAAEQAPWRSVCITKDFEHVTAVIRAGDYLKSDQNVVKHWLGRPWFTPHPDDVIMIRPRDDWPDTLSFRAWL